jgi:hypothetical protein
MYIDKKLQNIEIIQYIYLSNCRHLESNNLSILFLYFIKIYKS